MFYFFLDNPTIQSSVFDKTWPGNPIPLVPYDNPPAFQDSYTPSTSSNSRHQNTILHMKKKYDSFELIFFPDNPRFQVYAPYPAQFQTPNPVYTAIGSGPLTPYYPASERSAHHEDKKAASKRKKNNKKKFNKNNLTTGLLGVGAGYFLYNAYQNSKRPQYPQYPQYQQYQPSYPSYPTYSSYPPQSNYR